MMGGSSTKKKMAGSNVNDLSSSAGAIALAKAPRAPPSTMVTTDSGSHVMFFFFTKYDAPSEAEITNTATSVFTLSIV